MALRIGKGLEEFGKSLTGIGKTGSQKAAEKELAASKAAYEALTLPELIAMDPQYADYYEAGPSALSDINVNPEYREAQMDQLAALRNLVSKGGRSASSDAALARIQANELANERGSREAILQNAAARGMGSSTNSLLAQLMSAQNAQNNANLQDMEIYGRNQDQALRAAEAAGSLAGNMQQSDYQQQANRAAADDAIARFNATNRMDTSRYNSGVNNQAQQYNTGLQQQAYQNQFQKQAGIAGGNLAAMNYQQQMDALKAQQAGNTVGALIQGGTAIAGAGAGAPKKPAAAGGGRIPGVATAPGDSYENDTVEVVVSPDEVIVPRSLAKRGDPIDIVEFVKNPPTIKIPQEVKNREAALRALQNLRRRK